MTCEEAMLLLSGHLDQENSAEEEAQLSSHLAQCPACRELLAALQGNDDAIKSLSQPAPQSLKESVMQSIRKEKASRRTRRRSWIGLGVAAALVVVMCLSGLLQSSEQEQTAALKTASVQDAAPATLSLDTTRAAYTPEGECLSLVLELAQEYGADVVLLQQLPADTQTVGEPLRVREGWLLYTLSDAGQAAALAERFAAELGQPEAPDADCAVSYLLIAE